MGVSLGIQKSHRGTPGGNLSSQCRLLEGTFYGPTFYMNFGTQNLYKQWSFLERSTWLKHNKYCIELTFSYFCWGPGFSSIWDLLLARFWDTFGTKMFAEGAKRRPRGASRGGPFFGAHARDSSRRGPRSPDWGSTGVDWGRLGSTGGGDPQGWANGCPTAPSRTLPQYKKERKRVDVYTRKYTRESIH